MFTEPTDRAVREWEEQIFFSDPADEPELDAAYTGRLYGEMYRSTSLNDGYALNTTAWD
ncbi:MAG: hypothetical protein IJR51_00330 [Clostridia bacterium]|nr:hypothetical protein [Clostridia bacterium]MBQ9505579.1 hypothetical protein [Clostridia bacterium]MBR5424807.1 hypothetical protein [Clostridia bacterium]